MATEFTYKPAALSAEQTVKVDPDGITLQIANETRQLSFDRLKAVNYWSLRTRGMEFRGLEFETVERKRLFVRMNLAANGISSEEDKAGFEAMISTLLEHFARARPDLPITLGQRPVWRWLWFAMGLATLVMGAGILALALMDGRMERLGSALVPIVLLVLFGAGMSYGFFPLRPSPRLSPEAVLRRLRSQPRDMPN